MKISITRSYSRKIQVRQYEPVDSFCAATIELEDPLSDIQEVFAFNSKLLDEICRREVETTLATIRPSLKSGIIGKSKQEEKEVAKQSADLDAANQELNLN